MPAKSMKRIIASRFMLFVLMLGIIWVGIVLVKTHYKKDQLQSEIDNLKNEIEKIDKNNNELASLIEYFGSSSFLEKEAKEKLNLKKEGESVVMIPEAAIGQFASPSLGGPASQSSVPRQDEPQAPALENNFVKWWKYFFGR